MFEPPVADELVEPPTGTLPPVPKGSLASEPVQPLSATKATRAAADFRNERFTSIVLQKFLCFIGVLPLWGPSIAFFSVAKKLRTKRVAKCVFAKNQTTCAP
jgi:hypothetical protein